MEIIIKSYKITFFEKTKKADLSRVIKYIIKKKFLQFRIKGFME